MITRKFTEESKTQNRDCQTSEIGLKFCKMTLKDHLKSQVVVNFLFVYFHCFSSPSITSYKILDLKCLQCFDWQCNNLYLLESVDGFLEGEKFHLNTYLEEPVVTRVVLNRGVI